MKVKPDIICTVLCMMNLTALCMGDETTQAPTTSTARTTAHSTTTTAHTTTNYTTTPIPDSTAKESLQAEVLSEASAAAESSPTDPRLFQQAEDNASAIRKLADVMNKLIYGTSSERCIGTGTNTRQLTESIKEGFTVLVGAVQDLNNTLHHFKDDLSKKVFTDADESIFEGDGPCPSPFFQAGDDCIYIETERLRYFDAARQACVDMGAKLAEFSNFDAFVAAVRDMDFHDDTEIYLGGTDEDDEGSWRWLSGTRIGYIPWGESEPSNSDDREHCLSFRLSDKKFNDIPCSYRRSYVCTKK